MNPNCARLMFFKGELQGGHWCMPPDFVCSAYADRLKIKRLKGKHHPTPILDGILLAFNPDFDLEADE